MRQHWYFITRFVCVLCGHCDEYRERRYGPKPATGTDEYVEFACGDHFA